MRMVGKLICGVMCFAATVASATVTTNLDSYVEYIQSSGTQYINPGVIITSTMAVEVDAGMLWDPMVTPMVTPIIIYSWQTYCNTPCCIYFEN